MRTVTRLALAAFIAGAPMAARADLHEGPAGGQGRDAQEKGGRGGDRMGKGMDFTPDQKARMKAIGEEQQKATQPLRDQLGIQMAELRKLVNEKAADAKLTAKLDELRKSREALEALHRKFMDQRAQVLTPLQKARVVLRMGRGGMGGDWRGGGEKKWGKDRDPKDHKDHDDDDDHEHGKDHHDGDDD